MKHEPISFEYLRSIGFRIYSTNCSHQVHMVWKFNDRMETALEVAASHSQPGYEWIVWLRSDLSHSRCRFCFMRTVTNQGELERLIEALTDEPVAREEFDVEQFNKAICEEQKDCQRRAAEYVRNERWSYVPG